MCKNIVKIHAVLLQVTLLKMLNIIITSKMVFSLKVFTYYFLKVCYLDYVINTPQKQKLIIKRHNEKALFKGLQNFIQCGFVKDILLKETYFYRLKNKEFNFRNFRYLNELQSILKTAYTRSLIFNFKKNNA